MNLQEILDTYRFQKGGKDLFPRDATQLTPQQETHLQYCFAQTQHLAGLRKTEARLQAIVDGGSHGNAIHS